MCGPVIIECMGLQGSGKTTLVRALIDGEYGYSASPNDLAWRRWALLFILRHPYVSVSWIATATRESKDLDMFVHKLYMFLIKAARWAYARHSPKRTRLIVDESFLQGLLSLYEHPMGAATLGWWLRVLPYDVVVLLERKEPYDYRRYISSERLRRGDAYVANWQRVFRENYEALRTALHERNVPVCRCFANDPSQCNSCITDIFMRRQGSGN